MQGKRPFYVTTPPIDRFWTHVNKHGPIPKEAPHLGRCWEWMGVRVTGGYGWFFTGTDPITKKKKSARAHRWIDEYLNGPFADDECSLHKCDNTGCVRPSHLWRGNHGQNMRDMLAKGRNRPNRHHAGLFQPGAAHYAHIHPETVPKGSKRAFAKLTEEKVVLIRKALKAGVTCFSLATEYEVSRSTVSLIKRGKLWKHV